jgi:hypothetical protein
MVGYLLCYDLSASLEEQMAQLEYWLDFLNSALPLPPTNLQYNSNSKWVILLVGVKSDLPAPNPGLEASHLRAWARRFPRLPIFPELFEVSSKLNSGVENLKEKLEEECNRIFSKHTAMIPKSYRDILTDFKSLESQTPKYQDELYRKHSHGLSPEGFNVAIQYLHAIGRLVVLKNRLVFPDPMIASRIAAKFVSPEEVRKSLLTKEGVQILAKNQIENLLDIAGCTTNKYVSYFDSLFLCPHLNLVYRIENEIALMTELGMCYELKVQNNKQPFFLFPNLSSKSSIQ